MPGLSSHRVARAHRSAILLVAIPQRCQLQPVPPRSEADPATSGAGV